ncbi:MAG: type II toxin-antitoxin system Phd/YefM family antitoxin [Deltaproteobacteria bacterium]|nr:type II toxin-antitoxin system Phd/YefM family antitoxin [Deltaproteobacteria bacterium]
MLKKISAMKARQNLGQLLNEVSIRGDSYIIERAGKALAALVDMERFQQLQEDRNAALQAVKNIWQKMQEADAQEVQEAIKEAVGSAKNQQIRAKA